MSIQRTKNEQAFVPSASTNAQGTFSASFVEGPYQIRINFAGYAGYPTVDLGVLEIRRSTPPLEYRYSGTRVSGTVVGPGGAGLSAGISAYYWDSANGRWVGASNSTTSEGDYFLVIPPGDYEFWSAVSFGGQGTPTRTFDASISAADTVIDIDLGGHEIRFLATLNGSTPLTRAVIAAEAPGLAASQTTGPDGRATLYLPDGDYRLLVRPDETSGYFVWNEVLQRTVSGPAELAVDLVRTRWNVTVRRSGDGSAIPFARVVAVEVGGGGAGDVYSDFAGKGTLLVRTERSYELRAFPLEGPSGPWITVGAGADSTFDLYAP